jgi:hypothetical protein
MRTILSVIGCAVFIFTITEISHAQGWRGIVPLKSNRTDVERLLGPSTERCGCLYKSEIENVFIEYTTSTCGKGGSYNVPRDTVITLTVYPKKNQKIADFQVSEPKFKRTQDLHMGDIVHYDNEEEGLLIEADAYSNDVRSIMYYAPKSRAKDLRCSKAAPNNSFNASGNSAASIRWLGCLARCLPPR